MIDETPTPSTDETPIASENMNRITVLLAEYNTLRAEIIQRIGGYAQLGIAAGLMLLAIVNITVAIIQAPAVSACFYLVPSVLFLMLVVGGWVGGRAIKSANDRLSIHLIELENRINKIAGGKDLLTWERDHARSTSPGVARLGGGRQR